MNNHRDLGNFGHEEERALDQVASKQYSSAFYLDQQDSSFLAARVVLQQVFALLDVKSIVDFGCGTGGWLRAARELGAQRLVGVEGPWVTESAMVEPEAQLVTCEMTKSMPALSGFDVAISLEVGEHLPPERAEPLVAAMIAAAPCVVFGAAIPGQGGTGHVNEQWPSYWAKLFAKHDYVALDLLRPRLVNERSIPVWYRSNPILYVQRARAADVQAHARSVYGDTAGLLDLVLPETYENPGLRHSLRISARIPRKVLRSIAWRLKIGRI